MPEPREQELFDTLLANGIKLVYKDGVAEKIVGSIDDRLPEAGIVSGTQLIMSKLDQVASKNGGGIPTNMRPDLTVEIAGNIVDAAKAAGKDIPDEAVAKSIDGMIKHHVNNAVQAGEIHPDDVAQAQQGANPIPTMDNGLMSTDQPQPAPKQEIPTMTERLAGGLL